mgnify:CR=1 FL=1
MNQKTAKHLRTKAVHFAKKYNISFEHAYKEMKKLYNETPRNKRSEI